MERQRTLSNVLSNICQKGEPSYPVQPRGSLHHDVLGLCCPPPQDHHQCQAAHLRPMECTSKASEFKLCCLQKLGILLDSPVNSLREELFLHEPETLVSLSPHLFLFYLHRKGSLPSGHYGFSLQFTSPYRIPAMFSTFNSSACLSDLFPRCSKYFDINPSVFQGQ